MLILCIWFLFYPRLVLANNLFLLWYRTSHFQPKQGGYKCLPCKKVFGSWRTFKRHRELHHGEDQKISCPHCNYSTTGRKDNLTRHMKSRHGVWELVSSLVNDILSKATKRKENDEAQVEEGPALSDYERRRNERVAEIEAEFNRQHPNFRKEVRELRVKRKNVGGRRKKATRIPTASAVRRSSRVGSKDVLTTSGEKEGTVSDPIQDQGGDCTAKIVDGNDAYPVVPAGEARVNDEVGSAGDESDIGKYGCRPCGMAFRDLRNLKRHVRLMHEERTTPVKCPRTWCLAEFSALVEMMKHKETCLLMCPYTDCEKTFRREKLFSAHQRAHLVHIRRMSD